MQNEVFCTFFLRWSDWATCIIFFELKPCYVFMENVASGPVMVNVLWKILAPDAEEGTMTPTFCLKCVFRRRKVYNFSCWLPKFQNRVRGPVYSRMYSKKLEWHISFNSMMYKTCYLFSLYSFSASLVIKIEQEIVGVCCIHA